MKIFKIKSTSVLKLLSSVIFISLFGIIGAWLLSSSQAGTPGPANQKLGLMPRGDHSIARFKELESILGRPVNFVQINGPQVVGNSDGTPDNAFLNCVTAVSSACSGYSDQWWSKEIRDRGGSLKAMYGFSLIYRSTYPSSSDYSNGVQRQHYLDSANGKWDEQFHYIARRLRDSGMGNSILRPSWEMNGPCCGAGVTGSGGPEAYIAAWRRAHAIFKSYNDSGQTNFKFFWNPLKKNTTGNNFSGNDLTYYPGDAYVDIMGYDIYDNVWTSSVPKVGGNPSNTYADPAGIWNTYFKTDLDALRAYAIQHGKQIAVGEWAVHGGGCDKPSCSTPIVLTHPDASGIDNPYFIQQMFDWHNSLPATGGGSLAFLMYFAANSTHSGPHDFTTRVTTNGAYLFPQSRQRMLDLFGPATNPPPDGQPDLIVDSISMAPSNPVAGQNVVFSATIRNQGNQATPDGIIHGVVFRVNGNIIGWSDNSTTALAPGATRTVTVNGGFGSNPTGIWAATSGSHSIQALVDDVNRIPNESNESNNTLTRSIFVSAQPPSGTITLPVIEAEAGAFAGSVSVKNDAGASAGMYIEF